MNQNNGLEFLDLITLLSFALQLMNYQEILNQATTDDIFKELQHQDREYLDRIIENQQLILEKLTALTVD